MTELVEQTLLLAHAHRVPSSMPKTEKSTSSPVERKSLRAAAERFGIRRFRPGQMEVMEAVLSGKDALGVMPTGSGKSLTFQLPSLLLPKATVVVSPLISLMQDQVEKAEEAEIESAKLNSTLYCRGRKGNQGCDCRG